MNSQPPSSPRSKTIAHPRWTDYDVYLFKKGEHRNLADRLGSHPMTLDDQEGMHFSVYAPHADTVHVIGDFNDWALNTHPLIKRWDDSGIWEGFIPDVKLDTRYKYAITKQGVTIADKIDPMARVFETPPKTASLTYYDDYNWGDHQWMTRRRSWDYTSSPLSIYEMHLGSWRTKPDGSPYSYLELCDLLPAYLTDMGFTHVEFTPISEYPYTPSWGYQVLGYYAPTSRYGRPAHLKQLIDSLHKADIGVILDWVPSHFPGDAHGLACFDGQAVYEHPDPRRGYHPDWDSLIFDYGRPEIRSFLISSALHWIEHYHIDGLRVDAVASMLYLDYSREEGQWQANDEGGNINKEAVHFIQELNTAIHDVHPGVLTIAEESTAYEGVTRAVSEGGLGFDMKWMMGWMHDTLAYFGRDPIYRHHHQEQITFSMYYAFSERFVLPLSHDEVVHGKNSILGRMPGDQAQRFAQLRSLYGYMWGHPGAKLLFMGSEWGTYDEWGFDNELAWSVLDYPVHSGIKRLVRDLNELYRSEPAFHQMAYSPDGFEWMDYEDAEHAVISYARYGRDPHRCIIGIHNFVPVTHTDYPIRLPNHGWAVPIFSSEMKHYGGTRSELAPATSSIDQTALQNPLVHYTLAPMETMFILLTRDRSEEE